MAVDPNAAGNAALPLDIVVDNCNILQERRRELVAEIARIDRIVGTFQTLIAANQPAAAEAATDRPGPKAVDKPS